MKTAEVMGSLRVDRGRARARGTVASTELRHVSQPHALEDSRMLNPDAACLPSRHSALLLLAAAGSLPFNDAQVSSVSVRSLPSSLTMKPAHGSRMPQSSLWDQNEPGPRPGIECFQAGRLLARPTPSLGTPPSPRGCQWGRELWPLGAAVGAAVGTVCLRGFSESLQPAPELPEPHTLGRSGLLSPGLFTCPRFPSEAETHPHSRSPLAAGTFFAPSTY